MLLFTAMLPEDKMHEGVQLCVEMLLDLTDTEDDKFEINVEIYTNYFQRTWCDGVFKMKEWCYFGKVVRTNNLQERWHRSFGESASKKYQIDHFLKKLQEFEALATLRYTELKIHGKLRTKRKDEMEKEEKIRKLFTSMRNEEIDTFNYLTQMVQIYDDFKYERRRKKKKN